MSEKKWRKLKNRDIISYPAYKLKFSTTFSKYNLWVFGVLFLFFRFRISCPKHNIFRWIRSNLKIGLVLWDIIFKILLEQLYVVLKIHRQYVHVAHVNSGWKKYYYSNHTWIQWWRWTESFMGISNESQSKIYMTGSSSDWKNWGWPSLLC